MTEPVIVLAYAVAQAVVGIALLVILRRRRTTTVTYDDVFAGAIRRWLEANPRRVVTPYARRFDTGVLRSSFPGKPRMPPLSELRPLGGWRVR